MNRSLPVILAFRLRRGIALMELLVVLMLFSVFLVIASKLFLVAITAQKTATAQDTLIHDVDTAMSLMRKDVWASNRITLDEGRLELLGPNDGPVQWNLRDPAGITRTNSRSTTTWHNIPIPAAAVEGPIVKLTFPGKPPESITLVSEVLLNNRVQ